MQRIAEIRLAHFMDRHHRSSVVQNLLHGALKGDNSVGAQMSNMTGSINIAEQYFDQLRLN